MTFLAGDRAPATDALPDTAEHNHHSESSAGVRIPFPLPLLARG
jgi:hypothetical protein